jgi:hypothetical protein
VNVDSFKFMYNRFLGNLPAKFKAKWATRILFILYCLKRTNHQAQARNIGRLLTFGLIPQRDSLAIFSSSIVTTAFPIMCVSVMI